MFPCSSTPYTARCNGETTTPPPAPLTPPTGPNSWGRPRSPYSTSHTALQQPPPRLPPSLPPPGQSGTQASKAPPSPIPCGTRQSWETRPTAPKTCPASIAETQYRKPTSARAPAPQTAAHNPGHVQPPPPSASTPPRRLRPCFRPFSPHDKVLRTSPPLSREHKLTFVLIFFQRVISLKKPHLHVSLTPALNSPNTAQPISTTTLALTSHFCKRIPPPSHPPCSSRHALTPKPQPYSRRESGRDPGSAVVYNGAARSH